MLFTSSAHDIMSQGVILGENITGLISSTDICNNPIPSKLHSVGLNLIPNDNATVNAKEGAFTKIIFLVTRSNLSHVAPANVYDKQFQILCSYRNPAYNPAPGQGCGAQSEFKSIRYNATVVLPAPGAAKKWCIHVDVNYAGSKFGPAGNISVKVKDSQGKSVPKQITLNSSLSGAFSGQDDVDITGLAAGTYTISISFPDCSTFNFLDLTKKGGGAEEGNLNATVDYIITAQ